MARVPRVLLSNRQRRLSLDSAALRSLAARVLDGESSDPRAMVAIVILRDAAMAELNLRHRGQQGPTDVLTFPTDATGWPPEEPPLLGEVAVSIDRAIDEGRKRNLPAEQEVRRLIVHGLLHLLGYDHATARQRARMRRRENAYLWA